MKSKLNCVLLIDDDESTNMLNEMAVRFADCTEKIVAVQSGQAALDYLTSKEDDNHPHPDLIFLDINMPAMNGWEFIEEYNKLNKQEQGKVIVVMLTTSLNPDDKEKADKISSIDEFMNKPLKETMISDVIDKYFKDQV